MSIIAQPETWEPVDHVVTEPEEWDQGGRTFLGVTVSCAGQAFPVSTYIRGDPEIPAQDHQAHVAVEDWYKDLRIYRSSRGRWRITGAGYKRRSGEGSTLLDAALQTREPGEA